mgnify:CR=1 FL=1
MANALIGFLITALITAVSLVIISQLPFGVEVDSFGKAIAAGIVLGLLNAFVRPVFIFFGFPLTLLTLGAFLIVINAAIFGLAAWIVEGVRLRWGIWSALLGAIALSLINSVLNQLLARLF